MDVFSLLFGIVYAAETIISPIPDNTPVVTAVTKPSVSFGEIVLIPSPTPTPAVLGAETDVTTPTPTPPPLQTKKHSYTIAFLGDSMIDTMGPDLPAVNSKLHSIYAGTNFTLANYGVGGTNIDYGIERITHDYDYLGKHIASLASIHPDIVVLESFGYNPYPNENGVDRHWLAMAKAVDTLRASIPGVKIVIAATIAPNSRTFGDGAAGLAFSPEDKIKRTQVIKQYLANAVKFAQSQHLPLADAYHASLDANGDGILTYINGGDHIHYSDAGRALFAQAVVGALQSGRLLE